MNDTGPLSDWREITGKSCREPRDILTLRCWWIVLDPINGIHRTYCFTGNHLSNRVSADFREEGAPAACSLHRIALGGSTLG